jgi:hypothetical protein
MWARILSIGIIHMRLAYWDAARHHLNWRPCIGVSASEGVSWPSRLRGLINSRDEHCHKLLSSRLTGQEYVPFLFLAFNMTLGIL